MSISRRQWNTLSVASLLVATMPGRLLAAAPARGGSLVIGLEASPDFLDAMVTAGDASREINLHIYEMLISRDERRNPVADLATSYTESEDGLTYVFKLRENVKFHNGKTMTSEDVKGSFERYARVGLDKVALEKASKIEATDPLTLTVQLSERVPSFIEQISSPRAPLVIIPSEQSNRERGKTDVIGTGPYQLVEWKPDSHVTLKRFEGYVPNPAYAGTDGLAGKKVAYFDTVTFSVIPETGARVAALERGEISICEDIPNESAKRLSKSDTVEIVTIFPWSMLGAVLNGVNPPTDNIDVRRAIQIGINAEEIIAIATDGVYRLDYGWNYPESPYWAGDIGKDLYNQANVEKAKALLQSAGYKGEELVILTTSAFKVLNSEAVVLAEQLKKIGFNVRLAVFDAPTWVATGEDDPKAWNVFLDFYGLAPWIGPYGLPNNFTGPNNMQKVRDQTLEMAFQQLRSSPTMEGRKRAAAAFQQRLYDQAYTLRFGDAGTLQGVRRDVKGFKPFKIIRAWNVWFEK